MKATTYFHSRIKIGSANINSYDTDEKIPRKSNNYFICTYNYLVVATLYVISTFIIIAQ